MEFKGLNRETLGGEGVRGMRSELHDINRHAHLRTMHPSGLDWPEEILPEEIVRKVDDGMSDADRRLLREFGHTETIHG